MTAIHFNTVNQTYRQLLGNGLSYRVPRFQRDYSWSQDEWDDLWQDIHGVLLPTGEPAHYMGYLVLQTSDNKAFDVIDGQQRLTTLSVLVLAVLRVLQDFVEEGVEPENNRRRIEQLRSSYIGYLDPVTLVAQSKLTLSGFCAKPTCSRPCGPKRRTRPASSGFCGKWRKISTSMRRCRTPKTRFGTTPSGAPFASCACLASGSRGRSCSLPAGPLMPATSPNCFVRAASCRCATT